MSGRDWLLNKLGQMESVISLDPVSDNFIKIRRKETYSGNEYPPFVTAVISTKLVTPDNVQSLLDREQDFQFITNIPKEAIWTGEAIILANSYNLGWGGVGDLMSAIGYENVEDFQKKEYTFVERGLGQHTRVENLTRHFDRLIEVHRFGASSIKTVLLNQYELTAEDIRQARDVYGDFSAILRTNPNGGATKNAHAVASELGAEIFQWGEFLGRLNK